MYIVSFWLGGRGVSRRLKIHVSVDRMLAICTTVQTFRKNVAKNVTSYHSAQCVGADKQLKIYTTYMCITYKQLDIILKNRQSYGAKK